MIETASLFQDDQQLRTRDVGKRWREDFSDDPYIVAGQDTFVRLSYAHGMLEHYACRVRVPPTRELIHQAAYSLETGDFTAGGSKAFSATVDLFKRIVIQEHRARYHMQFTKISKAKKIDFITTLTELNKRHKIDHAFLQLVRKANILRVEEAALDELCKRRKACAHSELGGATVEDALLVCSFLATFLRDTRQFIPPVVVRYVAKESKPPAASAA